jgi:hypothetical protein
MDSYCNVFNSCTDVSDKRLKSYVILCYSLNEDGTTFNGQDFFSLRRKKIVIFTDVMNFVLSQKEKKIKIHPDNFLYPTPFEKSKCSCRNPEKKCYYYWNRRIYYFSEINFRMKE